ncbi:hypothetical protein HB815_12665 [Listeria booriae]|uniref:hypothetical protein n=1 Tax=Listeria booriae TaxID=1552123 RepID=UPI0016248DBD|nr:hypothetical protein [Listeria booriae]MBC1211771.1 hypothetical protein [Listeria booriae]
MKKNKNEISGLAGTFSLNKLQPIHRWYKYDEGYSSELIIREIQNEYNNVQSVYDPFAGSGTTPLVTTQMGLRAYYSETNPFMQFVTDVKINKVKKLVEDKDKNVFEMRKLLGDINKQKPEQIRDIIEYGGFEKYYDPEILQCLIRIKKVINNHENYDIKALFLLGLASILVRVSNMIKRGDLRFAKELEKKSEDRDVYYQFNKKMNEIIKDIELYGDTVKNSGILMSEDVREITSNEKVDMIITSPPYLNGTNYIRNTKLELQMLDFIQDERELGIFHSKGIIAGINNVSNRKNIVSTIKESAMYAKALENSYDKRISKMIIGYFEDMNDVLSKLSGVLNDNGLFVMDIGDSQFAGIHIPTDELLNIIAEQNNFELVDSEILRTRRSKNNMVLSQKLLRYRLRK